jgi:Tol biopolymer transport system component/DNA-binding winged helix-turn-helix (wHTH) protein
MALAVSPRTKEHPATVRFGVFTLDLATGELLKSGVPIRLPEQPFRVLRFLVERPNEIVTREELRTHLWPGTFVDFDLALNTVVRKIRMALNDSAENPRYIETLPKRGYRFIAPVEAIPGLSEPGRQLVILPSPAVAPESPVAARPKTSRRWVVPALAIAAVAAGGGVAYRQFGLAVDPLRVLNYTAITNDGRHKSAPLATDGVRLYFAEESPAGGAIAQVLVTGGPTTIVWDGFDLIAMAPDGSALLAHTGAAAGEFQRDQPFWILPLPAGSPRRLGIAGRSGAWSPDGRKLAYSNGREIYIADRDGNDSHKLISLDGEADPLQWSPDGAALRFTLWPSNGSETQVWEVSAEGAGLHPVLPTGSYSGDWSPNGRYYFFSFLSKPANNAHIRAVLEKPGFGRSAQTPFALTGGPTHFGRPLASRDGKKIFAFGKVGRGQLVGYDSVSRRWMPRLEGIWPDGLVYSPDGQWIAYTLYPEGTLWRSRADGSERLQLTFAPQQACFPRWSPDGRTIAFTIANDASERGGWKTWLIPAEGGTPQKLVPGGSDEAIPSWSPDGRSIAFGGIPWARNWSPETTAVSVYDFATRQVSRLAGSEGLWAPKWSPDGRYIAAETTDAKEFLVRDRLSGKWRSLARPNVAAGYGSWSRDSRYFYFIVHLDQTIWRVRMSDGHVESVLSVKDFAIPYTIGRWFGLAPDNSLLVLRDASVDEIYSLSLKLP